MDKKRALILCYTNFVSDPRVRRQIAALMPDFKIEVCAESDRDVKDIPFYLIYKLPSFSLSRKVKRLFWLLTRHFESFYWDDYKKKLVTELSPKKYDVIIANDIHTLPLALRIAGGYSKVYFDAHEYHPKEWASLKWKLLYKPNINYLCRTYIPKVNSFSTVSESISKEYYKFVGIQSFVISNASEYQELSPSPSQLPIKLIHHGAAIPERRIEKMIKMMDYLPNHFILYLMLTPLDQKYLLKLKKKESKKVKFIPAIPFDKICIEINKFDIGVFLLPAVNFNYHYALPNKIFEFIQARLAVVTTPNPEMKKLIEKYHLGKASTNYTPESMAEAVLNVAEKIPYFKSQSHKYAKELSAESNYRIIRKLVSFN
jgi:hypothetical protein